MPVDKLPSLTQADSRVQFWTVLAGIGLFIIAAYLIWPPLVLVIVSFSVAWWLRSPRNGLVLILILGLYIPISLDNPLTLETPTLLMASIIVISAIGRLQMRHFPSEPSGLVLVVAVAILALAFTTTTGWRGIESATTDWLAFIFVGIVSWHLGSTSRTHPEMVAQAVFKVAWSSIPLALLTIYQRVTETWPILDDLASSIASTSIAYGGRPGGTQGHPIILGLVAVTTLCIALGLRRKGWMVIVASSSVVILASGSRSAWISASVVMITYLLSRRNWELPKAGQVFAGIAALFAILVLAAINGDLLTRVLGNLEERLRFSEDLSAGARGLRIEIAWSLITQNHQTFLLGSGSGANLRYLNNFGLGDGQAVTFDNSYLSLWINHGLLGVASICLLIVIAFYRSGLSGRLLLVGFATEMIFFEVLGWPAALTMGALGLAMSHKPSQASAIATFHEESIKGAIGHNPHDYKKRRPQPTRS